MKKRRISMILAAVFGSALLSAAAFSVGSIAAGTDPLVTLGYLNDVLLPQWKKDIEADTERLIDGKLSGKVPVGEYSEPVKTEPEPSLPDPIVVPQSAAYTLLELKNGDRLFADSPLEIILRPGSSAVVYSPFPAQGIADITNSKEYLSDMNLPINTYLLIPRGGDGRCVVINNQTSYVLVRGEYSIG